VRIPELTCACPDGWQPAAAGRTLTSETRPPTPLAAFAVFFRGRSLSAFVDTKVKRHLLAEGSTSDDVIDSPLRRAAPAISASASVEKD
jgi:hypothetical protein